MKNKTPIALDIQVRIENSKYEESTQTFPAITGEDYKLSCWLHQTWINQSDESHTDVIISSDCDVTIFIQAGLLWRHDFHSDRSISGMLSQETGWLYMPSPADLWK